MKLKLFVLSLFLLAVAVGVITRLYKLGVAPAGLYIDEAAQGYNAYSLLKTGKDEFGKSFPFIFRSFTDFKTPVYIYLVVPLIPIFGLTAFSVRFPSFLFSILTLPVIYLLLAKLTKSKIIPIATTILLAISPWHILFGRTNFECNVALFFYLLGVYCFYLGLKKPWVLLGAAISFAIAIPAYHSQRIITPLTLLILFIRYKNILLTKTHLKVFIAGCVGGFLILLPTLAVAATPGFLMRAAGLNIFTKHGLNLYLAFKEFASLYLSYLTPRNMFILGDYGPRSSFPQLSTFFLWQLPFYLTGLYLLCRNQKLGELRFFTIFTLLISPIPAAVTRDPYSTIRALPLVIPQNIIIAIAGEWLIGRFGKNLKTKLLLTAAFGGVFVYSLAKLYSSVIILNEFYRARYWDYGWAEVVKIIKTFDNKIPIIVDNHRFEPYSQLLFFLKFDPATYQKENFEVPLTQYYTNMNRVKEKKIDNIVTRPINWEKDLLIDQYLVGDELAISKGQIKEHRLRLISEVYFPDRSVAFRIVRTNYLALPENK